MLRRGLPPHQVVRSVGEGRYITIECSPRWSFDTPA